MHLRLCSDICSNYHASSRRGLRYVNKCVASGIAFHNGDTQHPVAYVQNTQVAAKLQCVSTSLCDQGVRVMGNVFSDRSACLSAALLSDGMLASC